MKVLAVLLAVCLVGQCHCGDNDKVVEAQLPSEKVLDIVNLDSSNFTLFECNDNGNEIIFVIPRNDVSVDMVVCGETTIWTPGEDEEFEYAKLFLSEGQVRVLLIAKSKERYAVGMWFEKDEDKWVDCSNTHSKKIKAIRAPCARTTTFTLNIEEDEDTEDCKIFNVSLFGTPMRLYYARPGHHITKIMHNGTYVWEAGEDEEDVSTSCNLYIKDGEPQIFVIAIVNGEDYLYLEREGKYWEPMTLEEFKETRSLLIGLSYITGDKAGKELVEPVNIRPWWSGWLSAMANGLSRIAQHIPLVSYSEILDSFDIGIDPTDEDEYKFPEGKKRERAKDLCPENESEEAANALRKRSSRSKNSLEDEED
ncbi:signal peptide containing protein [Theileria equi strain WA]|uniref:Signal peptide containing protein n=1 Tax=Theileria equi strain WA TaxID=1537102 RepID=L1LB55_THEEQ|nr:signal peptide containing protein [Theileria equi strain WA]EKX72561.1 signal peptide containing protein [Theileria equi strain WA]|eukprot:XP_004832013.1 signal peptide containing protein [Theileria equi strain WA]